MTGISDVNALATGETLSFGPKLTVIYEPNGDGKAGFARVLKAVAKLARKLAQMWERAGKEIFDGRIENAQQETYGIGQKIAKWTYFRLSLLPESTRPHLRRIGLGLLHLVSMRVYMDGGASLQCIVDDAQVLVSELKARLEEFPRFDR